MDAAAPSFSVEVAPVPIRDAADIEGKIAAFATEPSGSLIVMPAAGALAASGGVKQLRRRASVPKPPDAEPKPPAFAFAVQMLPCHLVCGFVGICGRDEPSVLLLPAATAAKLDLVYVHDAKMLLLYTLLLSQ